METLRRLHHGGKAGGGKAGFTLLEVLIAVAILAIGVVGVVNIFPVGLQAARRTANFSNAAILARMQLELYRSAYGYDDFVKMFDVENLNDAGVYPEPPEPTESLPPPRDDYSWQIAVRNIPPADLRLLEMTLRIYWLDRGQEQFESFVTYIADHGE